MTTLRRSTNRERIWLAWCGNLAEIRKIALLAEDLFALRKKTLIENPARQPSLGGYDGYSHSLQFSATAGHGPDSIAGSVVEVFDEIDRRRVTSIEMSGKFDYFGPPHDTFCVRFDWGRHSPAVRLVVSSADTGWANMAFSQISDEIDLGVPRYSFMHNNWARFAIGMTSTIAVAWATYAIARVLGASTAIGLFMCLPTVLMTSYLVVNEKVFRMIFPAIELVSDTSSSTTIRRLAAIGALLASVAVGILVNYIS